MVVYTEEWMDGLELKYLKIGEYDSKINIVKKRFICHKCKKKFTEDIRVFQIN